MSRKRRPTPDGRHGHRHRHRSRAAFFLLLVHAAPAIIGLPVALLQNGGLSAIYPAMRPLFREGPRRQPASRRPTRTLGNCSQSYKLGNLKHSPSFFASDESFSEKYESCNYLELSFQNIYN